MVVVVGGGPGGLAVAACLKRRGTPVAVLDAGGKVGESWRNRYDRLRLHTPRIQSGLPGRRIPKRAGRWVARDDVAAYLEEYALHFEVDVEHNVRVERVDRRWSWARETPAPRSRPIWPREEPLGSDTDYRCGPGGTIGGGPGDARSRGGRVV